MSSDTGSSMLLNEADLFDKQNNIPAAHRSTCIVCFPLSTCGCVATNIERLC